eukprot:EG_transcript_45821
MAARIHQPSGAPGVVGGSRSKHASSARSTAHAAPSWVAGRVGPVPTARSTLRRRRCGSAEGTATATVTSQRKGLAARPETSSVSSTKGAGRPAERSRCSSA